MKIGQIIAFIVIGTVVSLALGYTVHRATGGIGYFTAWINGISLFGHYDDATAWTMGGIIIGAAIGYLYSQNSK